MAHVASPIQRPFPMMLFLLLLQMLLCFWLWPVAGMLLGKGGQQWGNLHAGQQLAVAHSGQRFGAQLTLLVAHVEMMKK